MLHRDKHTGVLNVMIMVQALICYGVSLYLCDGFIPWYTFDRLILGTKQCGSCLCPTFIHVKDIFNLVRYSCLAKINLVVLGCTVTHLNHVSISKTAINQIQVIEE